MKTAKDIVCYLDAEREESYKQYKYWKNIDSSEASKYLIRANTIESILDDIAFMEESEEPKEPQEPIAKILVSTPVEKKNKKSFLEIYVIAFFIVSLLTSYFSIGTILMDVLDILNISGVFAGIINFGYFVLHIYSFILVLNNTHFLQKTNKNQ